MLNSVIFVVKEQRRNEDMKCLKCGYEFKEGLFCPECGTKYNEEETKHMENETAQQQSEKVLIEQENRAGIEEQERRHQEELMRTFNGVLYNTIDEMNAARIAYDRQVAGEKATKRANSMAIWSFILALATYPLVMTIFLWFPSLILSIVFGVKAFTGNTDKKGFAIAGLIVDILYVLIVIIGLMII